MTNTKLSVQIRKGSTADYRLNDRYILRMILDESRWVRSYAWVEITPTLTVRVF